MKFSIRGIRVGLITQPHHILGIVLLSNTLSDFTQKCRGFEIFLPSQKVKMVIYVESYPCDSAILHNDKAKYIFMSMFVGLN